MRHTSARDVAIGPRRPGHGARAACRGGAAPPGGRSAGARHPAYPASTASAAAIARSAVHPRPAPRAAHPLGRARELRGDDQRDARQARIVECRFFAGRSIPGTAQALGIAPATVKREGAAARSALHEDVAAARDAL